MKDHLQHGEDADSSGHLLRGIAEAECRAHGKDRARTAAERDSTVRKGQMPPYLTMHSAENRCPRRLEMPWKVNRKISSTVVVPPEGLKVRKALKRLDQHVLRQAKAAREAGSRMRQGAKTFGRSDGTLWVGRTRSVQLSPA